MKKRQRQSRRRTVIQIAWTALSNGYIAGFLRGGIYQGPLKQVCLPGLNCYSCPGALGACPIGALQAVGGSRKFDLSFYALGFLIAVGALVGRLACGFLCPFGLAQDLLHKLPLPKRMKLRRMPGETYLRYLRYIVLAVLVLYLPAAVVNIIGQGDPWFCKYLCPSGTLMGGLPLLAANEGLRQAAGGLFAWKVCVLLLIVLWSTAYYRPFCKFLCPLGALYGLTNPVSLYRYRVLDDRCTDCGACAAACKMGIDPRKTPNSPDCIRCGACVAACPHGALLTTLARPRKTKDAAACNGACAHCGQAEQGERA